VILLLALAAHAQTPGAPVRAVSDPGVVPTRQAITPAGAQSVFVGKVQGAVFGATQTSYSY